MTTNPFRILEGHIREELDGIEVDVSPIGVDQKMILGALGVANVTIAVHKGGRIYAEGCLDPQDADGARALGARAYQEAMAD